MDAVLSAFGLFPNRLTASTPRARPSPRHPRVHRSACLGAPSVAGGQLFAICLQSARAYTMLVALQGKVPAGRLLSPTALSQSGNVLFLLARLPGHKGGRWRAGSVRVMCAARGKLFSVYALSEYPTTQWLWIGTYRKRATAKALANWYKLAEIAKTKIVVSRDDASPPAPSPSRPRRKARSSRRTGGPR